MNFARIAELLDYGREIKLGPVGSVGCAAIASDEATCLAMLVRGRDESFMELLERLDQAIEDAIENDVFVDEING